MSITAALSADASPAVYSVRQTQAILNISHATVYRLIDSRKLDARKIVNKTVITAASIEAFLQSLPRAASQAPPASKQGKRRAAH